MKRVTYALLASVFIIGMTACSSNEKNRPVEVTTMQPERIEVKAPERMQVSDVKTTFDYRGKSYTSSVVRRPDDALTIVKDEQGNLFVDNRITLRLTSAGRTVLERAFTKADFASYVEPVFLKHALLEGLVFDQTTERGMEYAASVAYPESDLYVPLRITISPNGSVAIERGTLMDEYNSDGSVEQNKGKE